VRGVSSEALQLMMAYPWPGNVRELRNIIERIVILEPSEVIEASHLPSEVRFGRAGRTSSGASVPFLLPEEGVDLEAVERSLLQQAMERTASNQSAAARLLGITRYALRYRLEKFGLGSKKAGAGD
jgi:DNA-binding NtrC family response regulator